MSQLDLISLSLRLTLGLFFVSTGYNKVFVPVVRDNVQGLFKRLHVPHTLAIAIPFGELLGGLGVLSGCMTYIAAGGLISIMCGAICLDTWESDVVAKSPRNPLDWIAKTLYMPESLLTVMLAAILITGPGVASLDAIFWRFLF